MPKLSELTTEEEKKKLKLSDVQGAGKPKKGERKGYGIFPWADPQAIGDLARSAWNNATDPIVGAVQFAANQDAKTGGKLATAWADKVNAYALNREKEYQASTPDGAPALVGAVIGGGAPFMFGPGKVGMELAGNASRIIPAVKPTGTLANAFLGSASRNAQRAVGGGSQGALYGLVSPNDKNDGTTKEEQIKAGAIAGAVLPVAIAAGARGSDAGRAAWEMTVGNLTQAGADKKAAEVIRQAALRPERLMIPQPSPIPGSQRSLAEESMDEGVAGLQNIFKNPAIDDVRRDANNTARNVYLETITGTGSRYDDAIAAREANNEGAFEAARSVQFPVPKPPEKPLIVLPQGVERPSVPQQPDALSPLVSRLEAVKAEFKGGKAEGVVQSYISRIKAAKGDGRVLDNIRRDLNDEMSKKDPSANIRDLAKIKDELNTFLKDSSPEFNKALTGWANDSKPINRMDIGNALVAPSTRGAAQDRQGYEILKPQQFKGRVDNLDVVAQRATGFNRAKADDYLTPDDMSRIGNVSDDLERQRFADTKGALFGSPTAQRIRANDDLKNTALSQIPGVGSALKFLDDRGQTRLRETLGEVLLNPQEARRILANQPVSDRLVLQNALRSMGWAGTLLGGNVR